MLLGHRELHGRSGAKARVASRSPAARRSSTTRMSPLPASPARPASPSSPSGHLLGSEAGMGWRFMATSKADGVTNEAMGRRVRLPFAAVQPSRRRGSAQFDYLAKVLPRTRATQQLPAGRLHESRRQPSAGPQRGSRRDRGVRHALPPAPIGPVSGGRTVSQPFGPTTSAIIILVPAASDASPTAPRKRSAALSRSTWGCTWSA